MRPVAASALMRRPIESAQYTSLHYSIYAKARGIALPMCSIGNPWDNAVAETFFAGQEKEMLRRERFATREQPPVRILWYIECFSNTRRRNSGLGHLSPADYETQHQQETIPASPPAVNGNGSIPSPVGREPDPAIVPP